MTDYILWVDLETTGLSLHKDKILEVGAVITDMEGNIHSRPFQRLVYNGDLGSLISETSSEVVAMHNKSGLWEELWSGSTENIATISESIADWVVTSVGNGVTLYPGGNSVSTDRKFIDRDMPELSALLSHRIVDTTSIGLFMTSVQGNLPYGHQNTHRALEDAIDSLEEYRYLRGRIC